MSAQTFLPNGAKVIAFLGWPTDAALSAQADVHAKHVALAAKAHTRGRGFTGDYMCAAEIAEVITSAAACSLSNPTQSKRVEAGNFSEVGGSFAGFSLVELMILNGHRKRTA